MPLGQFDERIMFVQGATIDDTYTPGTPVDLGGRAGPGDNRVDIFQITNTDTVSHKVTVTPIATLLDWSVVFDVPARAGCDNVPAFDVLALAMPTGLHFWFVPSGFTLQVASATTPASGTFLYFLAIGGQV